MKSTLVALSEEQWTTGMGKTVQTKSRTCGQSNTTVVFSDIYRCVNDTSRSGSELMQTCIFQAPTERGTGKFKRKAKPTCNDAQNENATRRGTKLMQRGVLEMVEEIKKI